MTEILDLAADVLVVGGGPAATWAALTAARVGADVVLADKGYCGTSGATAWAGTGVWYVPPDPVLRETAIASRETLGGHLADRRWAVRVLDETYERLNELAAMARFPFPVGPDGKQLRNGLQGRSTCAGCEYWCAAQVSAYLTTAPSRSCLSTPRAPQPARWDIGGRRAGIPGSGGCGRAGHGGCAFQSKALGCDVNTGDGALFAVEAGAELSGMEFSNAYGIAPRGPPSPRRRSTTSPPSTAPTAACSRGRAGQQRSPIARELLRGKVFCQLDRADADAQAAMRRAQPNFFLTFDRWA